MTRRKWLMLAAGGVVAVALVGAGAVMAQTPTPGSGGGGTSFLDRVAQKLGIESSTLQNAVNSAANDQIDAQVQNGSLSQQQADKLKQRIANGQGPSFSGPGVGRGNPGKGAFGFGFGFGMLGADATKLAGFLNIPMDQLKTELQAQGATLATVAQAHGKSRDELKTFITDTAKAQLDQAVANKKMTQRQEDTALSTLQSHLDTLIDQQMPWFGGMHGRFGHGPGKGNGSGNDGTPSAGSTPSSGTDFGGPQFDLPSTTGALRS